MLNMKKRTLLLDIVRVLVGLLFIFSGLIKANDPLGLSYKMQEFFAAWGISQLNGYTLSTALVMNVFEVLAGVSLLVGWQMKLFTRLLLLLIIFFGFLTGYALLSGKIKECGCFGDCLPLTDLQSFLKDVFLFLLILLLFFNHRKIKPLFKSPRVSFLLLACSVLFVCYTEYYVLRHLPVLDCLPYKTGRNIPQEMQVPAGAVPDSFALTFQYLKNGKQIEFDAEHIPTDTSYHFLSRYDRLVRKGNDIPAISDFSLLDASGADITDSVLKQPHYYVLVITQDLSGWKRQAPAFAKVSSLCKAENIPCWLVTASTEGAETIFGSDTARILRLDATVIRAAARVNATYYLLWNGNILAKNSYADADDFLRECKTLIANHQTTLHP